MLSATENEGDVDEPLINKQFDQSKELFTTLLTTP